MSGVESAPELAALYQSPDVHVFSATAVEDHVDALDPTEAAGAARMVPRRVIEFASGRACARAALRALGAPAPVGRGERGEPLWPLGTTGSISHTRGYCLAAAGPRPGVIGLDVECIARIRPGVERRILNPDEQQRAARLAESERRCYVATVFAAKEAFYKAHHQIDPRYLGFGVVSVTVGADGVLAFVAGNGDVAVELLERAAGRHTIAEGRVVVGVTIRELT